MGTEGHDTWKCPHCGEWVTLPLRRQQEFREAHKRECRDEAPRRTAATVKRASLWDGVVDTYQTEGELNGFKPVQGAML